MKKYILSIISVSNHVWVMIPSGAIAHQQRYQPKDSNETAGI